MIRKSFIIFLMLSLLLAGCGAGQESTLETWDIEYNVGMGMMAKSYDSIDEVLADSSMIVRAKVIDMTLEMQYGVWLKLEVLDSSAETTETVALLQVKDPNILLLKNEEAVLVLRQENNTAGQYSIINDDHGLFRVDQETGKVTGRFLDELLESAPDGVTADSVTLEDVFDLLAERNP